MKKRYWLLTIVPTLALAGLIGCNGAIDQGDEALFPPTKGGGSAEALKPVESKEFGTITGSVAYDGEPPERLVFPQLGLQNPHADKPHCLKGGDDETHDQTWTVDAKTKAVANVVVWVDPPKGYFFPKPEQKTWQDEVKVDQPFCAFQPHVVVLYPETYDIATKALVPTGQKLVVLNTAPILHNFRMQGRDNPSRGGNVQPGSKLEFTPRKDRQELSFNCDVHKFMTGYAITFDHPYAAVTDKAGKFTIKNVPAGSELTFMAWHEAKRKFVPVVDGGNKIKLNANETKTLDFKISK